MLLGDYHDIYLETGEVVHFVFDIHCTYTYDGMILCLCNHDILRVRAVSTCTYLTPYVLCVYVFLGASLDVLLLCDIFENFRKTAMSTYDLDPANCFTLPGFSWDALLRVSGARLDLLSDIDMHQFVEHGMRGGVSMVTQRYARASNELMVDYDPSRPPTFLQYLDANNLYGWAMCQYLPASDFSWQEPTPELVQDILRNPDDAHAGYMVECDLTVPPALHDHFKTSKTIC